MMSHHLLTVSSRVVIFFFFNDTATTEIYTLSLHDALPISTDSEWVQSLKQGWQKERQANFQRAAMEFLQPGEPDLICEDRKSTRLNSSHSQISYAVFCLKKKKDIRTFHTVLFNPYAIATLR